MRRVLPPVLALTLTLILAACAGGGGESLADLEPPTAWTDEEQAVIDTYARFRSELTEITKSIDGDLDRVLVLATPRLSEGLTETITAQRSVGDLIDGRYQFQPLAVDLGTDGEAQLTICSWDQTFVVNEGEQLTPIPEGPTTARVDLDEGENGGWLVNGIFEGEGQDCTLDQ